MASLGEDLLVTVNKLQDLVFNTIGSDSLDLPQIVSFWFPFVLPWKGNRKTVLFDLFSIFCFAALTCTSGCCRLSVVGQVLSD